MDVFILTQTTRFWITPRQLSSGAFAHPQPVAEGG